MKSLSVRLFLAAAVPCFFALVLVRAFIYTRNNQIRLDDFVDKHETLARTVSKNLTAALAFSDQESTAVILSSLFENEEVIGGVVFDANQNPFSAVGGSSLDPPQTKAEHWHLDGGLLNIYQPIIEDQRFLGMLAIQSSTEKLDLEKHKALRVSVLALSFSLIIAILATTLLQKSITDPLSELMLTTKQIIKKHDYGIRTKPSGPREIFVLGEFFNRMLDTIQEREVQLQAVKQRFEFATQGTTDGLWEWEVDSGYIWYSDRYHELLGYQPGELAPHYDTFFGLIHPKDRDPTAAAIKDHFDHNKKYDTEFRLRAKTGNYVWFRSRGDSIRDEKGTPVRMGGSIQDIEDLKMHQKEQIRLLNTLKGKNREMEQIIYVTSHDLRSPLVNIQGFSQELKLCCDELFKDPYIQKNFEELLSNEIPEILNFILTSTATMDRLLAGLLKISRLGRAALHMEILDMNALVSDCIKSHDWQSHQIQAEVHKQDDLPHCWGDHTQTSQIFNNLLSNALKYSCPSRKLRIEIGGASRGEVCTYWVKDNGLGISKEHQKIIFEVFHRLDPNDSEGEGLGLTIVKKSLERQNGDIWLESTKGEGSCFYFSLPFKSEIGGTNEE